MGAARLREACGAASELENASLPWTAETDRQTRPGRGWAMERGLGGSLICTCEWIVRPRAREAFWSGSQADLAGWFSPTATAVEATRHQPRGDPSHPRWGPHHPSRRRVELELELGCLRLGPAGEWDRLGQASVAGSCFRLPHGLVLFIRGGGTVRTYIGLLQCAALRRRTSSMSRAVTLQYLLLRLSHGAGWPCRCCTRMRRLTALQLGGATMQRNAAQRSTAQLTLNHIGRKHNDADLGSGRWRTCSPSQRRHASDQR